MRPLILAILAGLAASPALAQGDRTDHTCSSQMLSSVIIDMPTGLRNLDPRQLSCLGLAQVYFLQTSFEERSPYEERQRIAAVFRREGLTR